MAIDLLALIEKKINDVTAISYDGMCPDNSPSDDHDRGRICGAIEILKELREDITNDRSKATVAERITSLCGGTDIGAMHRWLTASDFAATIWINSERDKDVIAWLGKAGRPPFFATNGATVETALAMAIIAAVDSNPEAAPIE